MKIFSKATRKVAFYPITSSSYNSSRIGRRQNSRKILITVLRSTVCRPAFARRVVGTFVREKVVFLVLVRGPSVTSYRPLVNRKLEYRFSSVLRNFRNPRHHDVRRRNLRVSPVSETTGVNHVGVLVTGRSLVPAVSASRHTSLFVISDPGRSREKTLDHRL